MLRKLFVLFAIVISLSTTLRAQKIEDFNGTWDGELNMTWNSKNKVSFKCRIELTAVGDKKFKGSITYYDINDNSKIIGEEKFFDVGYDQKENLIFYFSKAITPDGQSCIGTYKYRLSDNNKSLNGAFEPGKKNCVIQVAVVLSNSGGSGGSTEVAGKLPTLSPGSNAPVVNIKADRLFPFKEGLAIVAYGNSYGLIDSKGAFVVPYGKYEFDNFSLGTLEPEHGFINGAAVTKKINSPLIGMIDKKANLIIPTEYLLVYPFDKEGWARVTDQKKQEFFINRAGTKIPVSPVFYSNRTSMFSQSGGLKNLFNAGPTRDIALSTREYHGSFNGNISPGRAIDGSYSYFDRFGKQVINDKFKSAEPFSEGLACVSKVNAFGETKYGFIDRTGKLIIPLNYTNQPGDFHNGLAYVEPTNKSEFRFAFINRHGDLLYKQQNAKPILDDKVPYFEDGYFRMILNDGGANKAFKVIDSTGKELPVMHYLKSKLAGISKSSVLQTGYYYYPLTNYIQVFNYTNSDYTGGVAFVNLKTGNVVYTNLNTIGPFDSVSGLALASSQKGGKLQYINQLGNVIITTLDKGDW